MLPRMGDKSLLKLNIGLTNIHTSLVCSANTVIIMTSNLGAEHLLAMLQVGSSDG